MYSSNITPRPIEAGNDAKVDRVSPTKTTIGIVLVACFAATAAT